MIQAEFKREQDRCYLILRAENKEDYQIRMLEENEVKGILPFTLRCFNGEDFFYYDITSRQTYANLYSGKDLEWQDLRNFFTSLEAVMEETDRYLMDRSGIYFHPDFCFKKPGENRTEWIFWPDNRDGMIPMAEFIMEHVNHKDSKAMELSYRFYGEVKDDTFCLSEFMEVFSEREGEQGSIRNSETGDSSFSYDDKGSDGQWEKYEAAVSDNKTYLKENNLGAKELSANMTNMSQIKQAGILEKLRGKIFRNKEEKKNKDYRFENKYWENLSGNQECMEYDDSVVHETTIIDRNSQIKGYLRPMTAKLRGRGITLEHYPCVIGKLPEFADIVLNYNSISRMHARISKEGEEYYIEDLNSRNGTRINGFPIEHSEKVRIRIGDEVAFADLIYIFE